MSQQQFIIRYFIPSLFQKPSYDSRNNREYGGNSGWVEFIVHGRKTAALLAAKLSVFHGSNNVSFFPFKDPVRPAYKRRTEPKRVWVPHPTIEENDYDVV